MSQDKYNIKHSHGRAIMLAMLVSTALIAVVSLIGREAINLQGALLAGNQPPREINVIAALQEQDFGAVDSIDVLPKRTDQDLYPFHVKGGADHGDYFVLLRKVTGRWVISGVPEKLKAEM